MSAEPRLKAGLWVQAAIRAASVQGVMATIARKGDPDAGAILIKQNLLNGGFCVLTQIRRANGQPGWLRGTGPIPVEESVAEAYIQRQIGRNCRELQAMRGLIAAGVAPTG